MSPTSSILVVDNDEKELAYLFRECLKRSDFISISFTDPLLTLEHFKQNPNRCSLIVTDLRISYLDGITLVRRIREINHNVKILLITSFAASEEKEGEELTKDGRGVEDIKLLGKTDKSVRMKGITQIISQKLIAQLLHFNCLMLFKLVVVEEENRLVYNTNFKILNGELVW